MRVVGRYYRIIQLTYWKMTGRVATPRCQRGGPLKAVLLLQQKSWRPPVTSPFRTLGPQLCDQCLLPLVEYRPISSTPAILNPLAARHSVLAGLEQAVEKGLLEIEESGQVHRFGSYQDGANHVRVTVVNDSFWPQMLL